MDFKENVILLNHPLLQHKITILRDKNTGTNDFRRIVKEIAVLEGPSFQDSTRNVKRKKEIEF